MQTVSCVLEHGRQALWSPMHVGPHVWPKPTHSSVLGLNLGRGVFHCYQHLSSERSFTSWGFMWSGLSAPTHRIQKQARVPLLPYFLALFFPLSSLSFYKLSLPLFTVVGVGGGQRRYQRAPRACFNLSPLIFDLNN